MAPEIMTISKDMLSNVQKDIHKYYYNTEARDKKTKKLVLNVMDKKSMCCTYQLAVLPKARLDKQKGSHGNIFHAIRFLKTIH